MAALIAHYGLLAILLGAGVEGEAVVLTGGILAARHLLPLWGVAVAAAVGSFAVDQLWFHAGRKCRDRRFVQNVITRPAFGRAIALLERYPVAFIFSFRFLYGLRTVSPIAIGTTQIAARKFVLLNALAAAIWGPTIALVGYHFGKAVLPVLHRVGSVERHLVWAVAAAALFLGLVLLGIGLIRRRR